MHVIKRVDIGILDEAFFLTLHPLQNAPLNEQPNGVDKVAARFLMFELHANVCSFESRLCAHKSDDRIAQPDERRLTISTNERSQRE